MPDIITHYLFGLDTAKSIQGGDLYPIIKKYRQLFYIGLQGPDPMYYHQPYKKNNYHYIGKLMHQEKTGDFLMQSLTYTKQYIEIPSIYEPLMAYISGMLCHYILDSRTHPYIFYRSGRYIEENPDTYRFKGLHKHFELSIDSLLLKHKFDRGASRFKIHKHILQYKEIPSYILDLYDHTLFTVYAVSNGGQIFKESYKGFRKYYQLSYDPIGLKKGVVRSLDPILPKDLRDYSDSFSYFNVVLEFYDYLNQTKKVWRHPVTGTIYTFSFYDLLHNSLKLSTQLLEDAYNYTQSTHNLEQLLEALPNISYLTGLSCQDNRSMIHFDVIQ